MEHESLQVLDTLRCYLQTNEESAKSDEYLIVYESERTSSHMLEDKFKVLKWGYLGYSENQGLGANLKSFKEFHPSPMRIISFVSATPCTLLRLWILHPVEHSASEMQVECPRLDRICMNQSRSIARARGIFGLTNVVDNDVLLHSALFSSSKRSILGRIILTLDVKNKMQAANPAFQGLGRLRCRTKNGALLSSPVSISSQYGKAWWIGVVCSCQMCQPGKGERPSSCTILHNPLKVALQKAWLPLERAILP